MIAPASGTKSYQHMLPFDHWIGCCNARCKVWRKVRSLQKRSRRRTRASALRDKHLWPSQRRRDHRERLLAIDPRCAYCRRPLTGSTATLDHVQPKSRGGAVSSAGNLVLACQVCNQWKSNLTPWQWYKSLLRLVLLMTLRLTFLRVRPPVSPA